MEPQEKKRQCPKIKAVFAFQVEDWKFSHLELHQYFINKKKKIPPQHQGPRDKLFP